MTKMTPPRGASSPAKGATRGGLVGLIASAVAVYANGYAPGTGEAAGALTAALLIGLGKTARDRGWPVLGTLI